jgi:hypothetical protein
MSLNSKKVLELKKFPGTQKMSLNSKKVLELKKGLKRKKKKTVAPFSPW